MVKILAAFNLNLFNEFDERGFILDEVFHNG